LDLIISNGFAQTILFRKRKLCDGFQHLFLPQKVSVCA
jgi:hypothetical protein